jgi:hypothetical protein
MDESKPEADAAQDPANANSRETGGEPAADDENQGATTSSTPGGEYVGRIAGDDVGYAGETGAERRAEEE